jgi:hypothetical protein
MAGASASEEDLHPVAGLLPAASWTCNQMNSRFCSGFRQGPRL